MSPDTFEKSQPAPSPENHQEHEISVGDAARSELIDERIARIDGHAVPLTERVHNETQRTDPTSIETGTRYSRHPHIRDWLDRLGTRHQASKK